MKNLTAVVHDHSIIDQEMVDGYLKPFSDDQIFRGIFRLIRHREGDLTSDVLKKMETPVLLIWGEEDRIVPIQIGERLHKDLPNSTLHALKKPGTSFLRKIRSLCLIKSDISACLSVNRSCCLV